MHLCGRQRITYRGIRIAGLGGSMRYRDGANMYTEREMAKRVRKLSRKVRMVGGCDILLTHAPAAGMGDLDDLPHRGFECFNAVLESWGPTTWYTGICTSATVAIFSMNASTRAERRSSILAATRSLNSTIRATPHVVGKRPGSTHKPCAASSSATRPSSPQPPEHPGNKQKPTQRGQAPL